MIIPDVQMAINKVNNLGFTAFFNMIKDGRPIKDALVRG